jgi:3-hydroxybutyryl-CoA dehydrogenase
VVDGLRSAPATGDALVALAERLGHRPVRCKDMPGFVVNHAGRGMNTEGLRIAQEGVAEFADIDAVMREQAGFRMGPFELMDLTGLDVSHPVMESIYRQFYDEPRFRPSPITAVRLAGGLLGRKTGAGFYDYAGKATAAPASPPQTEAAPARTVWVSAAQPRGHAMVVELLGRLGVQPQSGERPTDDALIIVTPLGDDATSCAVEQGLDASRVVAVDTLHHFATTRRRTLMATLATQRGHLDAAVALFGSDGVPVTRLRDSAGFVAQRVVACIVNIACEMAQQRIAVASDIDAAVRLGLGYPAGPLSMGDALGPALLLEILGNLQRSYGDPRYRPSRWLARRAQLGLSLLHEES